MYATGGRHTARGNTFGLTVAEVDVYDFRSKKWLTTGLPDDLPSPRAGTATVVFDGKVMVMGGESSVQTTA
jgi:N-acetylneuraminic acid mutarotase